MNDELQKVLIGAGGSAATWIAVLARMIWRGRRKETAEEVMRKELWGEIGNLRKIVSELTSAVIDWQGKYLSLLSKHESISAELDRTQERLSKIGGLLNDALRSLDRIEQVNLHLGENPNLLQAKIQLDGMKLDAALIRQRTGELNQLLL
jgi:hypothetical protein